MAQKSGNIICRNAVYRRSLPLPEFLKLCSVRNHDQLCARKARLDELSRFHCRTYQSLYFANVHCESPDRVNSVAEFQTYLAIGSFSSSLFLKVPVEHIGYGAQMRLRETWLLSSEWPFPWTCGYGFDLLTWPQWVWCSSVLPTLLAQDGLGLVFLLSDTQPSVKPANPFLPHTQGLCPPPFAEAWHLLRCRSPMVRAWAQELANSPGLSPSSAVSSHMTQGESLNVPHLENGVNNSFHLSGWLWRIRWAHASEKLNCLTCGSC